jgi:hypothetical protein
MEKINNVAMQAHVAFEDFRRHGRSFEEGR